MKIDIFSGFLGAGKTTLIKKLIKDAYAGEKVVLIENEFGEVGIDGGFLQDAGINITEMNSGCICCSLVGDFATALKKVVEEYAPERGATLPTRRSVSEKTFQGFFARTSRLQLCKIDRSSHHGGGFIETALPCVDRYVVFTSADLLCGVVDD